MAGTHLEALYDRMQIILDDPKADDGVNGLSVNQSEFVEMHPVSHALGVAYTILQKAIIGYYGVECLL